MEETNRDIENLVHSWNQRKIRIRPLQSAGPCVQKLISKYGISNRLGQREMETAWQRTIGDRWPGLTQVGGVRNGTLEVTVAHSMILQEIIFAHDELLTRIQEQMPQAKIKRVGFRIGPIRPISENRDHSQTSKDP